MPLNDLITRYSAARGGLNAKTVRQYRLAVDRFAETLGHSPELADLTDENIGRHAATRLAAGCARSTVSGEQSKLIALWGFLARVRVVDQFPVVRPIKAPARIAFGWTRDEMRKIWAAAEFSTPVGDVPGWLWWRTLFAVLWDTGERIGAVLQLRWEWIGAQTLYFPAECRKGGRADSMFPLHLETVAMLDRLPRDGVGPFYGRMSEGTLYNRLKRIQKKAGLPTDNRSKFHRWRRTTLSHFQAAGGDAQTLAGHSSRAITELYMDRRIVALPSPAEILFRPGA